MQLTAHRDSTASLLARAAQAPPAMFTGHQWDPCGRVEAGLPSVPGGDSNKTSHSWGLRGARQCTPRELDAWGRLGLWLLVSALTTPGPVMPTFLQQPCRAPTPLTGQGRAPRGYPGLGRSLTSGDVTKAWVSGFASFRPVKFLL